MNIPQFLERLTLDVPDNPDIFEKKPPKRPKLNDPVVDPRESWGEMFWRVSEFRPPPLVERSALPPELQTKKTLYDKFSKMVNNKYIEQHERKDKVERNDLPGNPAVHHEATVLKGEPTPDTSLSKIKRREKSFERNSKDNSGKSSPRAESPSLRNPQTPNSLEVEVKDTNSLDVQNPDARQEP